MAKIGMTEILLFLLFPALSALCFVRFGKTKKAVWAIGGAVMGALFLTGLVLLAVGLSRQ